MQRQDTFGYQKYFEEIRLRVHNANFPLANQLASEHLDLFSLQRSEMFIATSSRPRDLSLR